MKILITGMKQHGKDTVCELLSSLSGGKLRYISSSLALIDEGIFDAYIKAVYHEEFIAHGIEDTRSLFYVERDAHRKVMFDTINAYCVQGTETAKLIFDKHKCDIYNGMRNDREFYACKATGLFDLTVWVDASERKPAESKDSMKLTKYDCDIILDNNGTLSQLQDRCERLTSILLGWETKHKDDWKYAMKKFRYIILDCSEDLTFGTDDVSLAQAALKSHQFDCYIDTHTGIRVEYYDAEPKEIPEFVDIPIEEFLG